MGEFTDETTILVPDEDAVVRGIEAVDIRETGEGIETHDLHATLGTFKRIARPASEEPEDGGGVFDEVQRFNH